MVNTNLFIIGTAHLLASSLQSSLSALAYSSYGHASGGSVRAQAVRASFLSTALRSASKTPPPDGSREQGHLVLLGEQVEECILDDENPGTCLSTAGYTKATASFATVSEVFVAEIERLSDRFEPFEAEGVEGSNMIKFNKRNSKRHTFFQSKVNDQSTHEANVEYNQLISEDELVLLDTIRKPGMRSASRAFHLAGPRQHLHFDPTKVNAAIVTCGGLCPGLNNVIRELVHSLHYLYGASRVYGITGGFNGFHQQEFPPVLLTNEMVENIHHDGGTILRSSRGGFDMDAIIQFLKEKDITQLYVIGGDGTHRGAYEISKACLRQNMNVAVAGIPKTIDNDLDYIDRSFGFSSAVEAAQAGIRTAKTEAMCNVPNGIGIVKLMGRSARTQFVPFLPMVPTRSIACSCLRMQYTAQWQE